VIPPPSLPPAAQPPQWFWHPFPQWAGVHPQNPNWLQHWPPLHGLILLQHWATANVTALESTTKAINTSWAFMLPIPNCNMQIRTKTTLDAQNHELFRPETIRRSKNQTLDRAWASKKIHKSQILERSEEWRMSCEWVGCCFILTHL
jgi:hypothetical protein